MAIRGGDPSNVFEKQSVSAFGTLLMSLRHSDPNRRTGLASTSHFVVNIAITEAGPSVCRVPLALLCGADLGGDSL
jgi:hypothetical protein